MPLPNPSTTWKLIRFLIKAVPYAVPPAYYYLEELLAGNESDSEVHWMKWNFILTRTTPTGTSEDKAQFGLHIVNITGGDIDSSWIAGDFATVQSAMDTFVAAVSPYWPNTHTLTEYRAYHMAFNPNDPGPNNRRGSGNSAFAETGPPVYIGAKNVQGGSATQLPYQVAHTLTLRTAWARHWGRIYLPGCPPFSSSGRIGSGGLTTVANAGKALGSTLADSEFHVVVPVTQLSGQTFHGLLGVDKWVADDIPDIQRRRRPRQAAVRQVGA